MSQNCSWTSWLQLDTPVTQFLLSWVSIVDTLLVTLIAPAAPSAREVLSSQVGPLSSAFSKARLKNIIGLLLLSFVILTKEVTENAMFKDKQRRIPLLMQELSEKL